MRAAGAAAIINASWHSQSDDDSGDDGREEGEEGRQPQLPQQSDAFGHVTSPAFFTLSEATAPPSPSPSASSSSSSSTPQPLLSLSLPSHASHTARRPPPMRASRSVPRASHRPPPLVLTHSASRSAAASPPPEAAAAAAAATTVSSSSSSSVLVLDDADKRMAEERLQSIGLKLRQSRGCLHSLSLLSFAVQQLLCIAEMVLAGLWRHQLGIAAASTAFVFGILGSVGQAAGSSRSTCCAQPSVAAKALLSRCSARWHRLLLLCCSVWYYQCLDLDSSRLWLRFLLRPVVGEPLQR